MLDQGKAFLPVFSLDPDGTHWAPIHSGHLHRLANVTGGACFRRDNQQDHLGSANCLTKRLARMFHSCPPNLTAATERQSSLLQDSLELSNDGFLGISMGAG